MKSLIREIEALTFRAFPALEEFDYDGWRLRFNQGYSRRANSVNPVHDGDLPLDEKLEFCETWYRERNQQIHFKTTPATSDELLRLIENHGYTASSPTSVQIADSLADFQAQANVVIEEIMSARWFENYVALNEIGPSNIDTLRQMFELTEPLVLYASIEYEGEIVSIGRGVIENGFIGLYGIATRPAHRRRGHAQKLVETMLAHKDVVSAYLMVESTNTNAVKLYEKLGFTQKYTYRYYSKFD